MSDERPNGTGAAYVIRPFAPEDDLPRLVRVMAEVEAADHDGEDVSEETLRGHLTLPGHDPARDRWVAVASDEPDTLLGWGFVWVAPGETLATLIGAVHPAWRGKGIGGQLMALVLDRARELGATRAGAYVGSRNEAAGAFLRRRGFAVVSANTLLRIASNMSLLEADIPAGYTVRTYADNPDPALFQRAVNRCYEGLWGHHTVPEEVVAEWLPTLDPASIYFLIGPDGDVAGTVRTERYGEPVGYVDAPGVVPEHRQDGLYVPLLRAAMRRLRERTPSAIELESWGDAPETLAQYEALGFAVVRQAVAYERVIG